MKPGDAQPELPKDAGEATIARLDKLRFSKGSQSTAQIRGKMQRVMQVRNAAHRAQDYRLLQSPCILPAFRIFCFWSTSSQMYQLFAYESSNSNADA